jgi:signal peptidase II
MRIIFYSALVAFLIDQISKVAILFALDLPTLGHYDVFPPLLRFHMAWNYGINFGLFSEHGAAARWVLIGLSVVISVAIIIWALRSKLTTYGFLSCGLLVGGALGNALDRVIYGAVVDFLNMSCCGINNPYAFNLADVFIFAGAIGLAIFPTDAKDGVT